MIECMVLAFKVFIGGILWTLLGCLVVGVIGLISYALLHDRSKEEPRDMYPTKKPKPKYTGKPIVIQGEKDNE